MAATAVVWAEPKASGLEAPLTLEESLDFAMINSPALKIVQSQLKQQEGLLVTAVSSSLPSVTLEGSYSDRDDAFLESAAAQVPGTKNWSTAIMLRHSVFSGGGVTSSIRSSFARKQAAKARFQEAVEQTILDVKARFYSVLVARQIISVRQEALDVLGEQLGDVKARNEAGVASEFELLQAQVALANERPNLIRAQNDYQLAMDNLLATIGAAQTQIAPDDVEGELAPETLEALGLNDLLVLAMKNRPQIRAADRDYAAAQSAVWSARSGYLPQVDAYAGYAWNKSSLSSHVSDDVNGWQAGVSVSLPLFDGFANASKSFTAKAARRQAAASKQQTHLSVRVEVQQAYGDLAEANKILESALQVVDQARESLRMAKERYAVGSSTQLDILQAQSSLSQARLNLCQAQYDALIAQASIQKATGSDQWTSQPTPLSNEH